MNIRQHFSPLFVLSALLFSLSGCMPLRPVTDPQMDKKAISLSNEARSFNRHIETSRGKGWAKLETPDRTDRYRTAWAAAYPDKLRITFLMLGNPVETVISTGEKTSFLSHSGKHDPYTTESKNPDMQNYLEIPVTMSELISILVGHPPLKAFDDAYFSPSDPALAVIVTRQKEKGGLQHLIFSSDGKINRIETLDAFGNPLYEILILEYKTLESNDIPVRIQIKDRGNRKLTLDITDFEPNPMIKDTVFQLTE